MGLDKDLMLYCLTQLLLKNYDCTSKMMLSIFASFALADRLIVSVANSCNKAIKLGSFLEREINSYQCAGEVGSCIYFTMGISSWVG